MSEVKNVEQLDRRASEIIEATVAEILAADMVKRDAIARRIRRCELRMLISLAVSLAGFMIVLVSTLVSL